MIIKMDKVKIEALRNILERLPNSILYMINSSEFRKLDKEKFMDEISREMTPNEMMNKIISHEDMYEDDVNLTREVIIEEFKKLFPRYNPFTEEYYMYSTDGCEKEQLEKLVRGI